MTRLPVQRFAVPATVRQAVRLALAALASALAITLLPGSPAFAADPVEGPVVVLAAEEGGAEETAEGEAGEEEAGGGNGLMIVAMIAAAGLVLGAFKMIGSSEP